MNGPQADRQTDRERERVQYATRRVVSSVTTQSAVANSTLMLLSEWTNSWRLYTECRVNDLPSVQCPAWSSEEWGTLYWRHPALNHVDPLTQSSEHGSSFHRGLAPRSGHSLYHTTAPAIIFQQSHRRSQDFVWGVHFFAQKSWRPFCLRPQWPSKYTSKSKTPSQKCPKNFFYKLAGVHFVSWGCTYTFFL